MKVVILMLIFIICAFLGAGILGTYRGKKRKWIEQIRLTVITDNNGFTLQVNQSIEINGITYFFERINDLDYGLKIQKVGE